MYYHLLAAVAFAIVIIACKSEGFPAVPRLPGRPLTSLRWQTHWVVPSLVLQMSSARKSSSRHLEDLSSGHPLLSSDKTAFSNLVGLAFKADECNSASAALNTSMFIACPMCGKFIYGRNRRQGLERHMRTHTKEKPYQCPMCPHRASMQHNMRNHILIMHTSRNNSSGVEQHGPLSEQQQQIFDSINTPEFNDA